MAGKLGGAVAVQVMVDSGSAGDTSGARDEVFLEGLAWLLI